MDVFAVFLTVVWLLLAALFFLKAQQVAADPSKGPAGTPPSRWRILGAIMIGVAIINIIALLA
jgi:predicted secreted protein